MRVEVEVDAGERPEIVFGRRLRELRTGIGWSQTEVSRRMNALGHQLHQTAIAKIEAGTRPLRLDEAWDLATVFNVPLLEFFYARAEDLIADLTSREELEARIVQLGDLLRAADEEIEHARLEEGAAVKKRALFRAELDAARRRLAEQAADADDYEEFTEDDGGPGSVEDLFGRPDLPESLPRGDALRPDERAGRRGKRRG
jgi:transcriptional regulator with XRE-family HTH domain